MPQLAADWLSLAGWVVIVAPVLGTLAAIWLFRFLPIQDYPDWLLQGHLLHQVLIGKGSDAYVVNPYPVPNAIVTYVLAGLMLVLPVEIAGKLFLSVLVIAFTASGLWLIQTYQRTPSDLSAFALLPALLIINGFVLYGLLNYLVGLVLFMILLGLILRAEWDLRRLHPLVIAGFVTLLFFSHATMWIASLMVLGYAVLVVWHSRALVKLIAAALPSLILLLLYVGARVSDNNIDFVPQLLDGGFVPKRMWQFASWFTLAFRMYPFDQSDALIYAGSQINRVGHWFFVGVAVIGLARAKGRLPWRTIGLLVVLLIPFIVTPVTIGWMDEPGERFIYPAMALFATTLAPRITRATTPRLFMAVLSGVLLLGTAQWWFMAVHYRDAVGRLEQAFMELEAVQQPGTYAVINTFNFNFEGLVAEPTERAFDMPIRLVAMRLPFYFSLYDSSVTNIFKTGVLMPREQIWQPTRVSQRWSVEQCPDTIYVIGDSGHNRVVADVLGVFYRPVFEGSFITVLRPIPESCT